MPRRRTLSISQTNDFVTKVASVWARFQTDAHIDIDVRNLRWDYLMRQLDAISPDDDPDAKLDWVLFTGHGWPGELFFVGDTPFLSTANMRDDTSPAHQFLQKLRTKIHPQARRGVQLNVCEAAQGENGQEFLKLLANLVGTRVQAWDDIFAIWPFGKEYLAAPGGECRFTRDTGRRFRESWLYVLSGWRWREMQAGISRPI